MRAFNRGQQALEYLVTYGWAFIVVLIVVGAFAYFGFLNPQQYLPDRCTFGDQLICTDFSLDSSYGQFGAVRLLFTNGFGEEIKITDVTTAGGDGTFCTAVGEEVSCPAGGDVILSAGEAATIAGGQVVLDLTPTSGGVPEFVLVDGEKTLVPVKITFSRNVAGAPEHYIYGEIFAEATGTGTG